MLRTPRLLSSILLAALAGLALFPLFGSPFYVELVAKIMILAIFAMSLDLLVGFTGLVSFGHAAYFGIAAYAVVLLAPEYERASLWLTLPASVLVAAASAFVIGFFVLRTKGIYFIMVTLAFAQMVYFVFHDTKIAGGSDGIFIYVRPVAEILGWAPFSLEDFRHFYFFTLALAVLVFV
ncbi:MAG TPA: branched-chain amino acid ABC transporter permease, partial [Burkholderiales bacterium]